MRQRTAQTVQCVNKNDVDFLFLDLVPKLIEFRAFFFLAGDTDINVFDDAIPFLVRGVFTKIP